MEVALRRVVNTGTELQPTPTENTVAFRAADFSTLCEALDYAALGQTGCNFYGSRGKLSAILSYADLREQAVSLARKLLSLRLERGARLAIIAETDPNFHRIFFACQYAGLVPVPVSASTFMSGREAYVAQLKALLRASQASVAIAPAEFYPFLAEAVEESNISHVGTLESIEKLPESPEVLRPSEPAEVAYLQYTSGSTLFPRGVVITQRAVLANLNEIISYGLKLRCGDRAFSWLPFYHDMGLVGFVLGPMVSQISVDYLKTWMFAMRPLLWLSLMTRSKATISFSPSFGYQLCAKRLRPDVVRTLELGAWRVAGVGAEMIQSAALAEFAQILQPSGFKASALMPCYGMAEASLAVSFTPLHQGITVDRVDPTALSERGMALPLNGRNQDSERAISNTRPFVICGVPLPGVRVEIRDEQGRVLPDRHAGVIFLRGANIMSGYFDNPEKTREVLSSDGWFDTQDIGYLAEGRVVIIGRKKDVIIINGRKIWAQDLEHLAEELPEVRTGDSCAFSVLNPDGIEMAAMVVQWREGNSIRQGEFAHRLQGLIGERFGIDCFIEIVPPHTLPRTSSGKLSRSKAREEFLNRHGPAILQRKWVERSASTEPPQEKSIPCAASSR
jgi:fatty-acyl-CoA synthase